MIRCAWGSGGFWLLEFRLPSHAAAAATTAAAAIVVAATAATAIGHKAAG